MSSVPYITPADPLPPTTSLPPVTQSALPPLVQPPVLPAVAPNTALGAQYVPVMSQVRTTRVTTGIKVVPIYD